MSNTRPAWPAWRQARKAAGLNQMQLADLLGVSLSFVNHIELGRRPCPDRLIEALPAPLRAVVVRQRIDQLQAEIAKLEALLSPA